MDEVWFAQNASKFISLGVFLVFLEMTFAWLVVSKTCIELKLGNPLLTSCESGVLPWSYHLSPATYGRWSPKSPRGTSIEKNPALATRFCCLQYDGALAPKILESTFVELRWIRTQETTGNVWNHLAGNNLVENHRRSTWDHNDVDMGWSVMMLNIVRKRKEHIQRWFLGRDDPKQVVIPFIPNDFCIIFHFFLSQRFVSFSESWWSLS